MNDEFVGMANYVVESIHDLLVRDPESTSDSASSQGSYHPSHECFMAEIADDAHREATPRDVSRVPMTVPLMGGMGLPPHFADGHGLWQMRRSHPTHV
jgi:hypothetical protein